MEESISTIESSAAVDVALLDLRLCNFLVTLL